MKRRGEETRFSLFGIRTRKLLQAEYKTEFRQKVVMKKDQGHGGCCAVVRKIKRSYQDR